MGGALEILQLVAGCLLCGAGLFLMLAGAVAGLRFPDFYARLHGGALGEIGHGLAFCGLACLAGNLAQAILLLALGLGCVLMGAGARHALADGANARGMETQFHRPPGRAP